MHGTLMSAPLDEIFGISPMKGCAVEWLTTVCHDFSGITKLVYDANQNELRHDLTMKFDRDCFGPFGELSSCCEDIFVSSDQGRLERTSDIYP